MRRAAAVVLTIAALVVCVGAATPGLKPRRSAEYAGAPARWDSTEHRASNTEHRASNTERRASSTERRDFSPGESQPTAPPGAAFFLRNLSNPRERREARADILDTPVLPGSIVKAVTLVTALEAGAVGPDSGAMCRRVVTVDGVRFVCAHPELQRPLTAAEALAHSCNDYFVSLARRLTREQVNRTRLAAGLPPLAASAKLGPALVGLDGPRVTPRALVDVMARLVGVGPDPPVPMRAETRRVLVEGLKGAATFGTAAAFGSAGVAALAKTGTAPMPGGGAMGVVVALAPVERPTHGLVVVAPGGAGVDAAAIAADLVRGVTAPTPAIRLGRTLPDGRTRVDTLALDDYVAEVLAGEGQPRAGDAAQEALAITARTFALANRNRHRGEGFDLCDTTHCQVTRAATAATRRAATATSGRALLHQGQPASVFYSAWCGGRIERASQVWPGAADYGEPARDDACAGEPPWQSDIRVTDVERALRAAGLRGGRLRGLRVLQRNASGRVVRLRAEGFTPPDISGHDFRMAMGRVGGWQMVKSTAFDVDRTGTGFRFRGRGFGHGVGLCVVGAGARAARGASADEILKFYFPALVVGAGPSLLATARSASTAGPVAAPSPGAAAATAAMPPAAGAAPAAPDVQVALPAEDEGERAALQALVRRARDAVAKATGQAAPGAIRVTVHPTVASFGRATGQPWWVSGATSGTDIDLLPLAILKQRGQLERTVRHEVAHAMLDGALASRPMWVREGAAIYFSREPGSGKRDPEADARSTVRVSCPSDADILRPISAGAQRDAYERAEACFARAIASGRKWDEVR
ncbi:MAG: SpoIID/LytB domain-containing protein [Acidobacteria bacterium]|nr:SpoIID/LytB domain-containing protein [Acidobacteriota bacterium]